MFISPSQSSAFSKNSTHKTSMPNTDDSPNPPCPESDGFGDIFSQLTRPSNNQSASSQAAETIDVSALQSSTVQPSFPKTSLSRTKSQRRESTINNLNYLHDEVSKMTPKQYKLLVRLWQDVTNAYASNRAFVLNGQIQAHLPIKIIKTIYECPDLLIDMNTELNRQSSSKTSKNDRLNSK